LKYRRHDAKRDESEPDIVKELEKFGYEVHREMPVDLLVHKLVSKEQLLRVLARPDGRFLLSLPIEVKTAYGKKEPKARVRKEQEEQNAYCARWQIDKPTCEFEALLAVGERIVL
jgi:hypothetical protein